MMRVCTAEWTGTHSSVSDWSPRWQQTRRRCTCKHRTQWKRGEKNGYRKKQTTKTKRHCTPLVDTAPWVCTGTGQQRQSMVLTASLRAGVTATALRLLGSEGRPHYQAHTPCGDEASGVVQSYQGGPYHSDGIPSAQATNKGRRNKREGSEACTKSRVKRGGGWGFEAIPHACTPPPSRDDRQGTTVPRALPHRSVHNCTEKKRLMSDPEITQRGQATPQTAVLPTFTQRGAIVCIVRVQA